MLEAWHDTKVINHHSKAETISIVPSIHNCRNFYHLLNLHYVNDGSLGRAFEVRAHDPSYNQKPRILNVLVAQLSVSGLQRYSLGKLRGELRFENFFKSEALL